MKKTILATISLFMILTLCFGATFTISAKGKLKSDLVVILKGEPSTLDPQGSTELVGFTVENQVFDTLVKKGPKGDIIPSLAKSWEKIDETTIRFHLRKDVEFSNGEKMTAGDVKYSIKRATTIPASATVFKGFDGDATRVVDDYTIDIHTNGPFAGVYNYLSSSRGAVVCEKAVKEMGDAAFARHPIGTGALKFESWQTGTSITLVRNDKYWGKKTSYSKLIFKFITESANRAIEIESGNADIVLDPGTDDIPRLSKNAKLNVISGPSYGMSYIMFDMKDKTFSDIKLREALALALDKKGIVKAVYGNLGTPAQSVIPNTVFSYKPQGASAYNVQKAKQLLAQAGYPKGLNVTFCVPNVQDLQTTAEIAQNMWKAIGVNATIKMSAMSAFLAGGRRGENQIGICAANYVTGDPGHALADFDTRGSSFFRANDKKIDSYLDLGAKTFDSGARAKVYQNAQQYISNQYYWIPIANKKVTYVTTKKINNFYCDPGNSPYFGNVVVSQ